MPDGGAAPLHPAPVWLWAGMTRRCEPSCGRSRLSGRGGGIAKRIARLLDQGWSINRKRTQRLWREEGLRVPRRRRKRQRLGDSTVPGERLRAQRPDHVWAIDFQFDVTEDGRALKLLYVVDEFTREALAMANWMSRSKPGRHATLHSSFRPKASPTSKSCSATIFAIGVLRQESPKAPTDSANWRQRWTQRPDIPGRNSERSMVGQT